MAADTATFDSMNLTSACTPRLLKKLSSAATHSAVNAALKAV